MGDTHVFTIKPEVAFRDGKNTVETTDRLVNSCGLGIRHHKDDYTLPRKTRFLVGNIFLKNFYSVYDYDQQEVQLGVNIHSKHVASITPYRWHHTWSEERGYKHLDHYRKTTLPTPAEDWKIRKGREDNEQR